MTQNMISALRILKTIGWAICGSCDLLILAAWFTTKPETVLQQSAYAAQTAAALIGLYVFSRAVSEGIDGIVWLAMAQRNKER